jgi:hypothetical protein
MVGLRDGELLVGGGVVFYSENEMSKVLDWTVGLSFTALKFVVYIPKSRYDPPACPSLLGDWRNEMGRRFLMSKKLL